MAAHWNIVEILDKMSGATFLGIDTVTTPVLKGGKKNPQQGLIQKTVIGSNVMCFQNKRINGYEAMVKRRLAAEGKDPASFELSPRTWGTRIPGLPLVEHKGKYYLEVIFMKAGNVYYTFNGRSILPTDIEGLPEREEGDQGGLENKVVIRTYALESLIAVTVDGITYHGKFFFE